MQQYTPESVLRTESKPSCCGLEALPRDVVLVVVVIVIIIVAAQITGRFERMADVSFVSVARSTAMIHIQRRPVDNVTAGAMHGARWLSNVRTAQGRRMRTTEESCSPKIMCFGCQQWRWRWSQEWVGPIDLQSPSERRPVAVQRASWASLCNPVLRTGGKPLASSSSVSFCRRSEVQDE